MGLLAAIDVLNLAGPDFLKLYGALAVCAVVAGVVLRMALRAPFGQPDGSRELLRDPYQIAYLAGGPGRAVDTAISTLYIAGALAASSTGRKFHAVGIGVRPSAPIERGMLDAAGPAPGLLRAELRQAVSQELHEVAQTLRREGLIPAMGGLHIRLLTGLPLFSLCLLGVAKILVGLERQRPVAILVFLVVLTLIGAVIAAAIPVYRTIRGERLDRSLKASHAALKQAAFSGKEPIAPDQAPLAVAMFGAAALAATPYAALSTLIAPPRPMADGSSSSCSSSSCSSSSCGGGGGGCGGCSS